MLFKKPRLGIGKHLGSIEEGTNMLISRCAKCDHSEMNHSKPQYHDEQRTNLFTAKKIESECNACKKEGKKCERFIPKK